MEIFSVSNVKIKSIVKVKNKETDSQYIQYSKYSDFFQLIYVVRGEAEVVFNDTVFINKPGMIVFLPQGENSGYRARICEDEECLAVFFSADFEVLPQIEYKNFIKNAKISALFEKMYHIWVKKETGYYNRCISAFYSVLAEMESSMSKYIPEHKQFKIKEAVEYIHEHYTEPNFPYEKLHELCGISRTHFNKLFADCFSVSPSEYVRKLKIERACELLITNEFSVTEVAYECGFFDVCYFSKVFKNEMGLSPMAFLKSRI